MPISKLVVGTDFSEPSNVAVSQSMNLARHVGAEVVLVHAGTIAEHKKEDFGTHNEDMNGWAEKIFTQHREELEAFRGRLSGQGVEISQAHHEGLPATSLCTATNELGANLLVVGSHGFSGISRFLLGNVAEEVVRNCSQDVLVARSPGGAGGFQRILVPLDLERNPETAIEMALNMVGADGEVELLHCWQLPQRFAETWRPSHTTALQEIRDTKSSQVKDTIGRLIQQFSRPGVRITAEQMEAPARDGICKRLDARNYDLLIIGSGNRTVAQRWWLGSVAESTIRHATCSALVLKNGE